MLYRHKQQLAYTSRRRCARYTKHLLVDIPGDLDPGEENPDSTYLLPALDAIIEAMCAMPDLLTLDPTVGSDGMEQSRLVEVSASTGSVSNRFQQKWSSWMRSYPS